MKKGCLELLCHLLLCNVTIFFGFSEARSSRTFKNSEQFHHGKQVETRNLKVARRLDEAYTPSNPYYNVALDSLSPYGNVMDPSTSPQENPPYCIYPPLTPVLPLEPPPSPSIIPSPTDYEPTPPSYEPNPPGYEPSTPGYEQSPPEYMLNPPSVYVLSPPVYVPEPPVVEPGTPYFLPPIIYPPPTVLPSPYCGIPGAVWCVAKPSVPDPIIQEAMNYACGSGADCDSIQPNGACYQPDTLIAHASYAFNSYFQRIRAAGGACDFGGIGMLVTRDPSYDGCRFLLN